MWLQLEFASRHQTKTTAKNTKENKLYKAISGKFIAGYSVLQIVKIFSGAV